jgi:protein involved in polysaccharide export with SLBB domain
MFRFMMDHNPLRAAALALVWPAVFVWFGVSLAPGASAAQGDPRDFPPLVDPNRPVGTQQVAGPVESPTAVTPPTPTTTPATEAEPEAYLLGVGDEVQINVLSAPELSGIAKVRPDGAITVRGAGMIHALGRTPEDVAHEVEAKLGGILRHARVDLAVTNFGESRVFVMGEVELPGDKPYYKGMSALQAVATAGGISPTGKAESVLVLRRIGPDSVAVRYLDLGLSLKGKPGPDMVLHPYDIVYVPRTFIAKADLVVDHYIRQMISPFSLYLEGWKAVNIGTDKYKLYP